MTKTKIRHHKRTDEPLLIPRSTAMYHGECDVDENGYPITYEVELWEYPDFLKREAKFSRHTFTAKTKGSKVRTGTNGTKVSSRSNGLATTPHMATLQARRV